MSGGGFVLASRSSIRVKLLTDAGLSFETDAADVDEEALGGAHADPRDRAMALAVAKATAVSARHAGQVVVGADQVGVLETPSGEVFLDKPRDPEDHVRLLLAMAGRTHRFFPAAALVRDGAVLARVSDEVAVTFRPFGAETARRYAASGEGRSSCGGYESEHRGAQLIEKVDGSLHAVLGLPLLGVLDALRREAPASMLP
jgi:septum formation protein